MGSERIYVTVCWVFAVSFLGTLVFLLVAPGQLTELLNTMGGAVGLSGQIDMSVGDLDYVLSLSLMGCIVALSVGSAVTPEPQEPYVALLVAKAVSTGGFALLAAGPDTVWVLPAVADGLVIVGLVGARHLSFPTEMADEAEGMA